MVPKLSFALVAVILAMLLVLRRMNKQGALSPWFYKEYKGLMVNTWICIGALVATNILTLVAIFTA